MPESRKESTLEQRALRLLRLNPDVFVAHDWGLTHRSLNGPLHVVKDDMTWCGGGRAYGGERNVDGRRCPRCMALVREEALEYAFDELDDATLAAEERFYA